MAAKLTRLTHKMTIQLHLLAGSCTICSSRSRWPVRKLLDTPSYALKTQFFDCRLCTLTYTVKKPSFIHLVSEITKGMRTNIKLSVLKESA